MRRRFIYVVLAALTAVLSACQGPAVKRGQRDIPTDTLPLACLTLGVEGGGWGLERVVFENTKTHERVQIYLNTSFDQSHPDYPTALEDNRNVLCMAIVHLNPGEYMVRTLEFTPPARTLATVDVRFGPTHGYRFNIAPGAANYLGTLYIAPNWDQVHSLLVPTVNGTQGQFSATYRTAFTQQRDKKWAEDVIPGMAKLPFELGYLQAF